MLWQNASATTHPTATPWASRSQSSRRRARIVGGALALAAERGEVVLAEQQGCCLVHGGQVKGARIPQRVPAPQRVRAVAGSSQIR